MHIFKFYDAKASSTSSLSSSSKVVSFLSNTNSITAATNKIAGITEYAWITENFEANAYRYPYDLPAIKAIIQNSAQLLKSVYAKNPKVLGDYGFIVDDSKQVKKG